MKSNKSICFITGGGTGGHIYPAVAVADYINERGGTEIYYIGNPKNLEYDIVSKKGWEFLPVNVHGMPRKACFDLIIWSIQIFAAVLKCMGYIMRYKPDFVFGTGGYVSAPALIAAKIFKIPFVMHDCDAVPGLVTRKLAPYASSVSLAFERARDYIHNENCYINGNPVRQGFKTLTKESARQTLGLENKLTVCIMGGSQGAKSINTATVGILKSLSKDYDVQVIFQTGKRKFETVEEHLSAVYPDYAKDRNLIVRPYFEDMVSVLKASDIAVSRAGSLSISEICVSGAAAIYVPYPHAASDHQRKNARYMAELGAGIYLDDSEVTSENLLKLLTGLIENKAKRSELQAASLSHARYDSVFKISMQLNDCL